MSGEYGLATAPEYEPGVEDSPSSEMQVHFVTIVGDSSGFGSFVFVVYCFGDHEQGDLCVL